MSGETISVLARLSSRCGTLAPAPLDSHARPASTGRPRRVHALRQGIPGSRGLQLAFEAKVNEHGCDQPCPVSCAHGGASLPSGLCPGRYQGASNGSGMTQAVTTCAPRWPSGNLWNVTLMLCRLVAVWP